MEATLMIRKEKMAEEISGSMSITEQILEQFLSGLKGQEGFNDALIDQLRELANRGELTKVERVSDVLKGGNHEAH